MHVSAWMLPRGLADECHHAVKMCLGTNLLSTYCDTVESAGAHHEVFCSVPLRTAYQACGQHSLIITCYVDYNLHFIRWVLQSKYMCSSLILTTIVTKLCRARVLQRPKAGSSTQDGSQDEDIAASEVTEVQAAVDLVQKQMRNYDGSFLQFRCDEKGFLSICAFGLPGKTHEDSPARAIQVLHVPIACRFRSHPMLARVQQSLGRYHPNSVSQIAH